jgi:hypothetical protein
MKRITMSTTFTIALGLSLAPTMIFAQPANNAGCGAGYTAGKLVYGGAPGSGMNAFLAFTLPNNCAYSMRTGGNLTYTNVAGCYLDVPDAMSASMLSLVAVATASAATPRSCFFSNVNFQGMTTMTGASCTQGPFSCVIGLGNQLPVELLHFEVEP